MRDVGGRAVCRECSVWYGGAVGSGEVSDVGVSGGMGSNRDRESDAGEITERSANSTGHK